MKLKLHCELKHTSVETPCSNNTFRFGGYLSTNLSISVKNETLTCQFLFRGHVSRNHSISVRTKTLEKNSQFRRPISAKCSISGEKQSNGDRPMEDVGRLKEDKSPSFSWIIWGRDVFEVWFRNYKTTFRLRGHAYLIKCSPCFLIIIWNYNMIHKNVCHNTHIIKDLFSSSEVSTRVQYYPNVLRIIILISLYSYQYLRKSWFITCILPLKGFDIVK